MSLPVVVTCDELTNPVFGVVNATGDRVGDRAMYFCQSGYLLSGERERTCQENGEWTGNASTCQRKSVGNALIWSSYWQPGGVVPDDIREIKF